jgi:hypothetical protein
MMVQCFFADPQLLGDIIHAHAFQSISKKHGFGLLQNSLICVCTSCHLRRKTMETFFVKEVSIDFFE